MSKTARDLSPQEIEAYRRTLFKKSSSLRLTRQQEAERKGLLKQVSVAASILRSRFGARRVILFGSLAHAGWFTSDSDVDLAVEGLSASGCWQAWQALEEIIVDRTVDLIDLTMASNSLREAIYRHGIEV
jgi:predicted nucleotidyltransferase